MVTQPDILFCSNDNCYISIFGYSITYPNGEKSVYNEVQMDDFKKELQNIINQYNWEYMKRYWTIVKGEAVLFDILDLEIPDFY